MAIDLSNEARDSLSEALVQLRTVLEKVIGATASLISEISMTHVRLTCRPYPKFKCTALGRVNTYVAAGELQLEGLAMAAVTERSGLQGSNK